MTTKYTQIGLEDQAKAIAKLPAGRSWLQYGCISGHADGHKGSSGGTKQAGEDTPVEDENSCREGVVAKKMPAGLVWRNRRKVEAAGIERAA